LYRLTSDVEKLPFPMAPVGALGNMALAESANRNETGWKWKVFSIGGMIGLLFGAVYVLLPAVSGVILSEPIRLFPIPWIDLTQVTENAFPAVATGIQLDLGLVFLGMVLPFWAVMGGAVAILITLFANPVLYEHGILHRWHKGMGTVDTIFANNFDFYMSFSIGLGLAIALVGIVHVFYTFRKAKTGPSFKDRLKTLMTPPLGRGDFNIWIALGIYAASTTAYILFSTWLVPGFPWIFLVAYGFIYTPIISFVSARLEGIAGQFVNLPMVREAGFIAASKWFGYSGLGIWYAPIPIHNYGKATVRWREIELTGTSFRSIIKAELLVIPVVMIASLLFSQYIWKLAPIPSTMYPYAQELWHLQALNSLLLQSATLEGHSPFFEALKFSYVGWGAVLGLVTYSVLAAFHLPIMLIYGVVRGLGQTTPHGIFLEIVGAVLGRYILAKKYGVAWRQYAPVLLAGFSCGMGLMGMLGMGFTLILRSLKSLPY
ncbi:MAG: peptide transporter, partial [Syntrophobacteraceae bacterium]